MSLTRLRRCPTEIGEEFWPPNPKKRQSKKRSLNDTDPGPCQPSTTVGSEISGPAIDPNVALEDGGTGMTSPTPSEPQLGQTTHDQCEDATPFEEATRSGDSAQSKESAGCDLSKQDSPDALLQKDTTVGPSEMENESRPLVGMWAGRLRLHQKRLAEDD